MNHSPLIQNLALLNRGMNLDVETGYKERLYKGFEITQNHFHALKSATPKISNLKPKIALPLRYLQVKLFERASDFLPDPKLVNESLQLQIQ